MTDCSLREEPVPYGKSALALVQLLPISSCPVTVPLLPVLLCPYNTESGSQRMELLRTEIAPL